MSSSLLKRFQASRESAPVESPLDKPASIHDDAGKVVAAVEPAAPATTASTSGPGLHAAGLPSEPVTKPVDAAGVAKDESADKNVVAAVKPATPSSSSATDLPASPVKEAKNDTAAVADDKADAEGKTAPAVQSVTPHHTTEDLDPEAAQVQPATVIVPMADHARETEEAYRAVEEATLHSAMEEFDRVQNGLESLRDHLNADNVNGGLSAESAFFAHFAVESLLKRFSVEDPKTKASFESAVIVPDGKSVIDLESLNAALEGVDAPVKTFGKRLAATTQRLLLPTYVALRASATGLIKIAEQADRLKPMSKATIRVSGKSIAIGDAVSEDLAGDLAKAATWLGYLVGKFDSQAKQDYKHNRELSEKAFENADEASKIIPAMKQVLDGWADPRRKLGGKASAPILGNYVFFKDQEPKYKGEEPSAKAFDKLANEAYPEVVGFQKGDGRVAGGSVEVKALMPKEIASLARQFELAAQSASAGKAAWEKVKAAGTFAAMANLPLAFLPGWAAWIATFPLWIAKNANRAHQLNKKPGEGWFAEDLRTVYDALVTSQRMTFHVGYDAMRVLRKEIQLFKKIAKQSLNAHAKASVEAFDQMNSLDGVSVNETAKNEPVQLPSEGHTATEKELMAKQDSWEDQPASFQTIEGEGLEAIDFDEAVNSCESLLEEADEIAILQQHYATEDEASGEPKARPGMIERVKALIVKIGEFFRSVWKRIVAFVTQQGNRLVDWAKAVRKHHFEKITVKLSGSEDAYIGDMKLPDLSPFYDFMDEAAGAGEALAKDLSEHANSAKRGEHGHSTSGHQYPGTDASFSKALASDVFFGNLVSDKAIPADGMVGAFKLSLNDGKLVETQVAKKVGEDKEYTVTASSLASFVEGAAKLIKKAEARVKAFEMKSDADWKRAKESLDHLTGNPSASYMSVFNLKPYGETAHYLMKAFSVLQSWARAVGAFAEKCIKGASAPLKKDDAVDAKFAAATEAVALASKEAATESLSNLPYWYHPAEA